MIFMRNPRKIQHTGLLVLLISSVSCTSADNSTSENSDEAVISDVVDSAQVEQIEQPPLFKAKVDQAAMEEVGHWVEGEYNSTFDFYNSGMDVVERWSDRMWGRCCTEADMVLSEHLYYRVNVNREGSKYPFKNATEPDYSTAYVFKKSDSISISISMNQENTWWGQMGEMPFNELISKEDTVMGVFEYSLINGYVKSEKTYQENGRIKEMEVWLNGTHMCNVELLDLPEIQRFSTNFPLFCDDEIKLIPISYYDGSSYDDICIAAVQTSLSFQCHDNINDKATED